jgi:hypothetical protein
VYNTSTVPLHFSLLNERLYNEYHIYQVTYNLDNKGNVTVRVLQPFPPQFPEELTWFPLANLTNGQHNIVVYAQDDFGKGYLDQVGFEVKTSNPSLPPSIVPSATNQNTTFDNAPNSIILFAIVTLIIAILLTLVLGARFKRRKSKAQISSKEIMTKGK